MGRAILSCRVEQIEDTGADTRRGFSPPPGPGSALAVPLLRNGTPLGVIAVGRQARGSFSRNQITLLETFAEQAVIAISGAETYRALQERTEMLAQRNSAFGERIAQQAATIDVLKAMSASPGDTLPVLDLITRHAAELCESRAALWELRDGQLNVLSSHGTDLELLAAFRQHLPKPPDRSLVVGRAILERRIVHVRDITAITRCRRRPVISGAPPL